MLAIFMFVPAFITATITAFLCGILLKLGYVSFITVFLAIVFGDLLSNIFWYMSVILHICKSIAEKLVFMPKGRLFSSILPVFVLNVCPHP